MRIFAERQLSDFLDDRTRALELEIGRENNNKLLNYDESQYVDYLVSQYSIDTLVVKRDETSVTPHEELISAEAFPGDFHVYQGKSYPKQVLTYYVPVYGDLRLLPLMPSSRILWTTEVDLLANSISFKIVNWRNKVEEIKGEADRIVANLEIQAGNVNAEVMQWNTKLVEQARQMVVARKRQLLEQSNVLKALGVSINEAAAVPEAFRVPLTKKKPIIEKPEASAGQYSPEPTLEYSVYQSILKICFEMGVEMERHPSVTLGKDEETLRDHFLMQLSPHFSSVTGETFNMQGKTDILIRHEGKNVFVAECKYWTGFKAYLEAVDQLLSYLTWRDSKSAILLFIQNREIGPVLAQIAKRTKEHPCFVNSVAQDTHGWHRFRFHLPDDKSRGVDVTVLCFHFPR